MSADPWGGPLLLQLVLILINGFFAATEVAVLSLNDAKVADADYVLADSDFHEGEAIVKKGKKKFYRLVK